MMTLDQSARLWDAETAAYRAAVERGASEAEIVQAVEAARARTAVESAAEQWRIMAEAAAPVFQQMARIVERAFAPAMAELRDLAERHPHLFEAAPEDDPRERALQARRTRNTGPDRGRLDRRR